MTATLSPGSADKNVAAAAAAAAAANGAPPAAPLAHQEPASVQYALSRRRWALLLSVATLGLLNGLTNELSSILNIYVVTVGLPLDRFVYVRSCLQYLSPLLAMPISWFVDRFGLRPAAYLTVGLVAGRNLSRALLFAPSAPGWASLRLLYWASLEIFLIIGIIMYYALPLKISEQWFSASERSFAWSFLINVPNLGSAIASLTIPRYVTDVASTVRLAYLNIVCLAASLVAIVLGVTRSKPPLPPSARSEVSRQVAGQSTLAGIRKLLALRSLMLQVLTLATFDCAIWSVLAVLQDVLAASGFSQVFTGQFLALNAGLQLFIAVASSMLLKDKAGAKGNTRGCKWLLFAAYLSYLAFGASLVSKRYLGGQQWWLMIVSMLGHSAIRCWASPRYNNLTAHLIAGHASEATMSALNTIVVLLLATPLTALFVSLRRENPLTKQVDYSLAIGCNACLVSLVTLLYLCLFSGRREDGCEIVEPEPAEYRNAEHSESPESGQTSPVG